jgi:Holliday junction resolvasome RuvABC endonuclease subunit
VKQRTLALDVAELDTGYAIIDRTLGGTSHFNEITLELFYCSHFSSTPRDSKAEGLIRVERAVENLVQVYLPDTAAVEVRQPTMQSSAIWRMRTDGVVQLALAKHGQTNVAEYYPTSHQSYFLGGRVKRSLKRPQLKKATRDLVAKLFDISIQTGDASDAAIVGLYHAMCGQCPQRETCRVRTSGLENLLVDGCPVYQSILLKPGEPILAQVPAPTRRGRKRGQGTT